jgi:hypothetical protein
LEQKESQRLIDERCDFLSEFPKNRLFLPSLIIISLLLLKLIIPLSARLKFILCTLIINLKKKFLGTPRPQPQKQVFVAPISPLPTQQRQPPMVRSLDPYAQAPGTPRPVDPYAQAPGTPRPMSDDSSPGIQTSQASPEINRQLRDLLQRQQFKKLEEEQLVPGQNNRIWPQERTDGQPGQMDPQQQPMMNQQDGMEPTNRVQVSDNTFRHPLPPAMRPRAPVIQPMLRGPPGVKK